MDKKFEETIVRRKPHPQKHEKTRSCTYRLPEKLLDELETEAMQKNISQNVLVKQILERYVKWNRFADKIGLIQIPKEALTTLGGDMESENINTIINVLKPVIKNNVMFLKGKYDLKRCIETLEDYMKASGMQSDHRIEGDIHHFVVQHGLGSKWSLFTEQLLKEIFHEFLPDKNLKCQTTDAMVIATIALGSDFDEHSY